MSITIYEITCRTTGKTYVGSTTCNLSGRLSRHKANYTLYKNNNPNNKYCSSFEIIKNANFSIKQLETCTPSLRHSRERFYIKNSPYAVNIYNKN